MMNQKRPLIVASKDVPDLDAHFRANQTNSPLLCLPAELRNKIYEHILGPGTIELCGDFVCNFCIQGERKSMKPIWHFNGNLAVISTCQQVYAEAKLLTFKLNTIVGEAYDLLDSMFHTFKTWQFHAITDIRIQFGTRQVHFERKDGKRQIHALSAKSGALLAQLRGLQGLKHVCVVWRSQRPEEWRGVKQSLLRECWNIMGKDDGKIDVVEEWAAVNLY